MIFKDTWQVWFTILCLELATNNRQVDAMSNLKRSDEMESSTSSPKYRFTFNVRDDEEQLYQRQTQKLENQVVTGEFSWVDALGTRHVTVYRADENGYHILEMRTEVGAVQIKPKHSRFDILPDRRTKLEEKSRTFQTLTTSTPDVATDLISNTKNTKVSKNDVLRDERKFSVTTNGLAAESTTSTPEFEPGVLDEPFLAEELEQDESHKGSSDIDDSNISTEIPPKIASLRSDSFGDIPSDLRSRLDTGMPDKISDSSEKDEILKPAGQRKIVRVVKRRKNKFGNGHQQRAPFSLIPKEQFEFGAKIDEPATTADNLPNFESFKADMRKSEPMISQASKFVPKVITHPVRILPIKVSHRSFPILLNSRGNE